MILVLANVSSDGAYADGMMSQILERLGSSREFYLEDHKLEVL